MSLDRRLSVLPSVMISVRELGTPAPMVKLLPGAPAALIQGVASQVHDVEGIHDRPRAGEFFSGCALKPGESIHHDDLDVLTPRVRREASQVLKTPLEQPGIIPRSREGPRRSRTGFTSKMTLTNLSPYGVWRHTCSSTPMTRTPSNRVGSLISRRWPSPRTAVLAALPGHA